jgi:GT2 family glycosyltransferase
MRASVIVVGYNSQAYLGPCIDSILAQLRAEDELIVVDNGSTDGSAELLRSRYPQVRLIESENLGYAGGNNRGAAQARGLYLVFLNPDTVLEPGALDALLAPLAPDDTVALSAARIVFMHRPDTVNACGNTMHYSGLAYCRGAGRPSADLATPAEVDAVSGAAFAIRRAVFEELGGFDERFFMYVEDTDLSWRARLAGYRCRYAPDALVRHDYRPSYSPAKAFYLERNRHLMLLKNLRRSTYLRMLPGLLLAELVTWGFTLLKGPRYWGVKPHVYGWLWRHRAELLRVRRGHSADRETLARMTYRLEFEQLASRLLAGAAAAVFNPAFWAARLLVKGGRV